MNLSLLHHIMLSKAQSQQTPTNPKACWEQIWHLSYPYDDQRL